MVEKIPTAAPVRNTSPHHQNSTVRNVSPHHQHSTVRKRMKAKKLPTTTRTLQECLDEVGVYMPHMGAGHVVPLFRFVVDPIQGEGHVA